MNTALDGSMTGEITPLLKAWSAGQEEALDQLLPLVYPELRRSAGNWWAKERHATTLQPTAIINELYMQWVWDKTLTFENRLQFFAFAGFCIRRILVQQARTKVSRKRGGGRPDLPFEEALDTPLAPELEAETLLDLEAALTRLKQYDPRKSQIVTMKYFAGMDYQEIAAFLCLSTRTVKREWRAAKGWLALFLTGGRAGGSTLTAG